MSQALEVSRILLGKQSPIQKRRQPRFKVVKSQKGRELVRSFYMAAEDAMEAGMVKYALEKAKEGLKKAISGKHWDLEHNLHKTLAAAHGKTGSANKAYEHIEKARALSRHASKNSLRELACLEANLLKREGNFREALSLLGEAARTDCEKSTEQRFWFKESLAQLYSAFGYTFDALSTACRAIKVAEKTKDKVTILRANFLIARIAFRSGNLETAERHLQKARVLADRRRNRRYQGRVLALMAKIATKTGRYAKAERYLAQCAEVAKELGEQTIFASLDLHYAELMLEKGEYLTATELAQRAARTYDSLGQNSQLREARALLGEALLARHDMGGALSVLLSEPNHYADSGINGRLRLAAAQLMANQLDDALESVNSVEGRLLSLFEYMARLRIYEELCRRGACKDDCLRLKKKYLATLPQVHKRLRPALGELLTRLGLERRPTAILYTTKGHQYLTDKELDHLDPNSFDLFYDTLSGIIYQRGANTFELGSKTNQGKILIELMSNPGNPRSRKLIYEKVWQKPYNKLFNDNNVYNAVCVLKNKLAAGHDLISSVHGSYVFRPQKENWGLLVPSLPGKAS